MSQTALADRMSELGNRWHQSTVTKIEAAGRSVRIGEARDLATILETTVDALTAIGTAEAASIEALTTMALRTRQAWRERVEGHRSWVRALTELRSQIESARDLAGRSERVDEALSFAEETLLMADDDPAAPRKSEGASDVAH